MFEKCEVCYKEVTPGTKNGDLLVEVKRLIRGKLKLVAVAHLECVEDGQRALYGRKLAKRRAEKGY